MMEHTSFHCHLVPVHLRWSFIFQASFYCIYVKLNFYLMIEKIITYQIMKCHAMPCNTITQYGIPYHTIPYHSIPYHTIPYHSIPYHTIKCHAMPYRMSYKSASMVTETQVGQTTSNIYYTGCLKKTKHKFNRVSRIFLYLNSVKRPTQFRLNLLVKITFLHRYVGI